MKSNHHSIIILGTALVAGTMAYAQQEKPQSGIQCRPEMELHKGSSYAAHMHGQKQEAGIRSVFNSQRRPDFRGPHAKPPLILDLECAKASGATDKQIKAVSEATFNQAIMRIELQATIDKSDLILHHLMAQEEQDTKSIMQAVDTLNDARGAMFKADILATIRLREMLGEDVFLKMQKNQHRGPKNRHDGPMGMQKEHRSPSGQQQGKPDDKPGTQLDQPKG